jgi:hypothetical protein
MGQRFYKPHQICHLGVPGRLTTFRGKGGTEMESERKHPTICGPSAPVFRGYNVRLAARFSATVR